MNLGFHCHRLYQIGERILSNELRRGEFYHFPPEDVAELKRQVRAEGLAASIHTPLVRPEWYPNPPTWTFLCDADAELRQKNLRLVELTMEAAEDLGAEYVVVHFPSPANGATATLALDQQQYIARDSVERLAELGLKHQIPIHIEGFGPSPFLTPQFLGQVAAEYPPLRYCWDVAHMYIAAQRDGFDYYEFAAALAPAVGSVHLWNTRHLEDYLNYRHIPVHPSQSPEDGWVDIPRILRLLLQGEAKLPIIFESGYHYPPALGNHDVREGMQWVKNILTTLS